MSGDEALSENDLETSPQLSQNTVKEIQEILDSDTLFVEEKNSKALNQRSSNRLTKRLRRDTSPVDNFTRKTVTTQQHAPPTSSKTRRPWELWSVEDKDAFFEALCEFGKDFDNIQSYIAQRSKKKSTASNIIKNKDQVRHFYYRTWHKISKFLDIGETVGKQTQELYGLINYAELRKKIGGCLNEKNRQKLNELVFSGVTTVKHKGKKIRIKTPVCRALKRLNNVTDTKEPDTEKLPKEVLMEFRPHTNYDWIFVQNLSQNPRVRTKVCLQKRLKSVIEFLQKKWRPYDLKQKEQILSSLPYSTSNQDMTFDNPVLLRVKPCRNARIYPLTFSVMDVASSSDVCLEKFVKISHKILRKEMNKSKTSISLNQKILNDKQNENVEPISDKNETLTGSSLAPDSLSDCQSTVLTVPDKANCENSVDPPISTPDQELSFSTILENFNKTTGGDSDINLMQSDANFENVDADDPSHSDLEDNGQSYDQEFLPKFLDDVEPAQEEENKECISSNAILERDKYLSSDLLDIKPQRQRDSIYFKAIHSGWTIEEAGYLTVGEIFLLLGKPAAIILEYEFQHTSHMAPQTIERNCVMDKITEIAQSYFTDAKNKQVLVKHQARNCSRTTKIRTCVNEKPQKEVQTATHKDISMSEETIKVFSSNSSDSFPVSSDKHVFVIPVGTAPRNVKPSEQNSLKEKIGKLLPGTRRGCRVRRKPLVVQRPLLPREGMGNIAGSRPMAVLHLMSSVSSIATVIPTDCAQQENKVEIPATKQVVKILPSSPIGTTIDMHPAPLIQQTPTDNSQNEPVLLNTVPSNPLPTVKDQINLEPAKTSVIPKTTPLFMTEKLSVENSLMPDISLESFPSLEVLNLDILSESPKNTLGSKESFCSKLTHTAVPSLSPKSENVSSTSSFLDDFGLTSSKHSLFESTIIPSYVDEGSSPSLKQSTPPGSPNHKSQSNSNPDIQWLNGENSEMSLNTFLNSLESPMKSTSSMTAFLSSDNSNLDPTGRLAPVVDSQVRCLLDEGSIDFITKFEDLADVINNSSSGDLKQA